MSFPDHFSQTADAYRANRPTYPPELAAWLATLPAARALAWDAGCGSGQLSVLLAEHFDRVVATDASERQIRHARPAAGVEYRCARAEASGLATDSADLIVAAQAAHWFDLPTWYGEVRRVARPGAAVALVSYRLPTVGPALDALVRRFHDETLAPYWPRERRHVVSGYADLSFPFPELPCPSLEITADWTARQFMGYVETWSGVRKLVEAGGEAQLHAFLTAVQRQWDASATARTVRWPLTLRAGRL